MTQAVNLFEEEKNVACKRESLHTGVMLATHILMLKSESERVWKLESLRVGLKLTSYEVVIMYL